MNTTLNSDLQTVLFWDCALHFPEKRGASSSGIKMGNLIDFLEKKERHAHAQCKLIFFRLKFGWSPGGQDLTRCRFTKSISNKI